MTELNLDGWRRGDDRKEEVVAVGWKGRRWRECRLQVTKQENGSRISRVRDGGFGMGYRRPSIGAGRRMKKRNTRRSKTSSAKWRWCFIEIQNGGVEGFQQEI